jgi:hypothetical protein
LINLPEMRKDIMVLKDVDEHANRRGYAGIGVVSANESTNCHNPFRRVVVVVDLE